MNNRRSPGEQFITFLVLFFGAYFIMQQFFGPPRQAPSGPPRPAPALSQAFGRIDPKAPLSKVAAQTELTKLQKQITANGSDEYSYWARLRSGLLQQYIVGDAKAAKDLYSEVIHHNAYDAVNAQALYQKGDLLWRESTASGGPPTKEAASALEQLVHKGRGSSEFVNLEIYVPRDPAATGSATTLPSQGFEPRKVRDLHGTLKQPQPWGVLDRVNQYYSTTTFYKIFDSMVKLLGDNPAYSYGLTLLLFAILTRLALQPLTKKQYDSMKGMQVIAPEMKKIQEKYKGKPDQQAQVQMVKEIRALQQRHGVNPMMGCGLALVQMPIMIFVVLPFIQHYEAKLELANASFLWIANLARPDIPLLVLYAISMLFSFRLSSTPPTDEVQRQTQMMMTIVMPLMFPFFLKDYPSAFTWYWMVYNVVSTIFQWRMLKAADPSMRAIKSLLGQMPPVAPSAVTSLSPSDAVPARPRSGANKSLPHKPGSSLTGSQLNGIESRSKRRGHETNGAALEEEDALAAVGAARDESRSDSGSAPTSPTVSQRTTAQRNSSSRRARRRRRH